MLVIWVRRISYTLEVLSNGFPSVTCSPLLQKVQRPSNTVPSSTLLLCIVIYFTSIFQHMKKSLKILLNNRHHFHLYLFAQFPSPLLPNLSCLSISLPIFLTSTIFSFILSSYCNHPFHQWLHRAIHPLLLSIVSFLMWIFAS